MRLLALLLLLCTASLAGAATWQDDLTPKPGNFTPLRPFHAHFKFGWGMLGASEADFDYALLKGNQARLTVTSRSVGAVRAMWKMDSEHVSIIDAATLAPISMLQSETYKDETITTKLAFTPGMVTRLRQSVKGGVATGKEKTFTFPQMYDLHAALQFIRSQPLKNGDVYKLVVYPAATPYLAEVNVVSRQKVKAGGQSINAIKLDLKLERIGKNLQLEKHDKFKRASAWLSDDSNRMLVRVESDIFVGSVYGEMDKIEWK